MAKVVRVILILILFGALFGIYSLFKKQPLPQNSQEDIKELAPLLYSCEGGKTIQVTFKESTATLLLSDGRILDLPQTVSASGIRYAYGGVVFISKGADGFLEENNVETYKGCIVGAKQNGTSMLFVDTGKTFQLSYGNAFTLSSGPLGYTNEWSANSPFLGLVLAKLSLSKEMQPKTNFSGATVQVGTSSDEKAILNCLKPQEGEAAQGTSVIGGIPFTKITLSDAGAGNFYETTSYRALKNSQCYAIEYTIHSTNIGAYSPEQGITAFDKDAVVSLLETVIKSFSFL